ncbi:MAG: hypothetical protein IJ520_01670 [Synergistaceae bacterium]|nr:hypothetical protein [Synergistaceae bacterium]
MTSRIYERDTGRDGVFQVMNPEGEIYSINTADANSPFYGTAWANILSKKERGEFLRGRAAIRRFSRDDRFAGYSVDIDGINAFLPASKAGWFREASCDACGKFLALKIESVYVNGDKSGTLIVNANAPIKYVLNRQNSSLNAASAVYSLAIDYDRNMLIFPWLNGSIIAANITDAQRIAYYSGISPDPNELTGYYWRLQIIGMLSMSCLFAGPLEVLV